jgi:hypothetical protein
MLASNDGLFAASVPTFNPELKNARMRSLIILVVVVLSGANCLAQADFRKGYIISNAGDTLRGLVDYREGVKAYRSCDFKKSETDNTVTYEPEHIIGYGFPDDKYFQSRHIKEHEQDSTVVFLELIVKGLVSLYRFEKNFYVEKRGDTLFELANESTELSANGRKMVKESNQHIGILNMLLFDCVESRQKILGVRLVERPLTLLIEHYNSCKGESMLSYKAKKPWLRSRLGFSAGAEFSKLHFDVSYVQMDHLMGTFEIAKSPLFGFSGELYSPRLSERISFHGDLFYLASTYRMFHIIDKRPIGGYTHRHNVSIELQHIKIPMSFQYTFPIRKITPFFSAGVSNTIHLTSNSTWIHEQESASFVETFKDKAVPLKKNQIGIFGGSGALFAINRKLDGFVELRYERTDGISDSALRALSLVKSEIANVQIIIGVSTK